MLCVESQWRELETASISSCYKVSSSSEIFNSMSSKSRREVRTHTHTHFWNKHNDLLFRYLATCSADTTVKIWSIAPNYEFVQEKVLQGHQRWVWDCAFSADSAYLVTGQDLFFCFVFVLALDCVLKLEWRFAASSDHTARLWEMASGETVRQYNGHHKGETDYWFYLIGFFTWTTSRDFADWYIMLSSSPPLFFLAAVCCALHDGASWMPIYAMQHRLLLALSIDMLLGVFWLQWVDRIPIV